MQEAHNEQLKITLNPPATKSSLDQFATRLLLQACCLLVSGKSSNWQIKSCRPPRSGVSSLKMEETQLPTWSNLSPQPQSRACGVPVISALSAFLWNPSPSETHPWVGPCVKSKYKPDHPLHSFPDSTGQNAFTSLHADKLLTAQPMSSDLSISQNVLKQGLLFCLFINFYELGVQAMRNKNLPVGTGKKRKCKRNDIRE